MLFENDLQAIFGIICFQKITVCSDLSHGVLNFRIRDMKKLGSRLWIRKVLPPPVALQLRNRDIHGTDMNRQIMNVCGTVHPSHFQRHRHWQQWQIFWKIIRRLMWQIWSIWNVFGCCWKRFHGSGFHISDPDLIPESVRIMQLIILCDKYSLHAFFLCKFQPVLQAKGETGGA